MISKVLIVVLALAAASSAAHAQQCQPVTKSADSVFRSGLTPAQYAKAKAQARKQGCKTRPVLDGTFGAVDAFQAHGLVQPVRDFLAKLKADRPKPKAVIKAKVKPKAAKVQRVKVTVKPKRTVARKAAPSPRPRPAQAPAAQVAAPPPSPAPVVSPAPEPPAPAVAVPELIEPAPIALPQPSKRERVRNWLRRLW